MLKKRFIHIIPTIIQHLEGGYYHPDMLQDGRVNDSRYGNSGETMFGIDRKAGGSINTTNAGREFWRIIDQANARKLWAWNYKGGALQHKLEKLVAKVMYAHFLKLYTKYLSPKAQKRVAKNNQLLFHFAYASWNGAGWFKRFANKINKAVASGVRSQKKLTQIAIDSRVNSTNSLIAGSGIKIKRLYTSGIVKQNSNAKWFILATLLIVIIVAVYYFREPIFKTLKIKIWQ